MERGQCKLCLTDKPLVSSHLLPRALYDLCRPDDYEPVMVTSKLALATSRQWQHPLLCGACDGFLSEKGEAWVLPLLATIDGKFPFYEILEKVPPDVVDGDSKGYAAAKNPDIDIESLTHFAIGIFWKASVHPWSSERTAPQIDLGAYGEELRTFLLGRTSFPERVALTVGVQPPPVKQISFNRPYRGSETEYHNFLFHVPGISFALAVGKQIEKVKRVCFYSSPGHPILLGDMASSIRAVMREVSATAYKAPKLMEYLEDKLRALANLGPRNRG